MTKTEYVLSECRKLKADTDKEKFIKKNMIKFYKENKEKVERLPLEFIESYSFQNEFENKISECTLKF